MVSPVLFFRETHEEGVVECGLVVVEGLLGELLGCAGGLSCAGVVSEGVNCKVSQERPRSVGDPVRARC